MFICENIKDLAFLPHANVYISSCSHTHTHTYIYIINSKVHLITEKSTWVFFLLISISLLCYLLAKYIPLIVFILYLFQHKNLSLFTGNMSLCLPCLCTSSIDQHLLKIQMDVSCFIFTQYVKTVTPHKPQYKTQLGQYLFAYKQKCSLNLL